MSTIVVLLGAELNSKSSIRPQPSTEGGDKPLGRRGAKMADTIGEAKA